MEARPVSSEGRVFPRRWYVLRQVSPTYAPRVVTYRWTKRAAQGQANLLSALSGLLYYVADAPTTPARGRS